MNKAQYIISLFEYNSEGYGGGEGMHKFKNRAAGIALGLGGLGVAALATHAATKGQSLGASLGDVGHGISNWGKAHNFSGEGPKTITTTSHSGTMSGFHTPPVVHQEVSPGGGYVRAYDKDTATYFKGYGAEAHTPPTGTNTPYGSSTGSTKAPDLPEAPKSVKAPEMPSTSSSSPKAPQVPSAPVSPKTPEVSHAPIPRVPASNPEIHDRFHSSNREALVPPVQPSGSTPAAPPTQPSHATPTGPGQVRQDTRGLGPTELVKKSEPDDVVRARGQEVFDRIQGNMKKMQNLQQNLANTGKGVAPSSGTAQVDQHVQDHAYYTRPATGRNWGYQLP